MSLLKNKKKLVTKLDDLLFEDINDKLALILPTNTNSRNAWKQIIENLGGTWKENKKGWILPKQKVKKLKQYDRKPVETEVETDVEIEKKSEKEEETDEDDSRSDSESDSTDDELIQKVLVRRFKSQSEQQQIEEENISDSENEDVLSLCKRLRFLYKEINSLKEELKEIKHKNQ